MRLLFEKGKQKELLIREKNKRNLTWKDFSKELGLKSSKLKTFLFEEVLIDDLTFNKLKLKKDYEKFIIERLDENWGQSKGGKISLGNLKEIKIPEKGEGLAELWGILLGDGNIERRKGYKIGTYNINITGHAVLDKDYLINFVKPLGEKLFNIKGRYFFSKNNNAVHIYFVGRKIVDYFEENEFKSGNKVNNQVEIPSWIKENSKYLSSCLRGLFDTDGCFYKLTNQNSCQIGFTNHNFKLLNNVREGLLSLGIGVSKIIDDRKLVITKRSEIAKFYKSVGFHNSKHLNKIKNLFDGKEAP